MLRLEPPLSKGKPVLGDPGLVVYFSINFMVKI